MAVHHRGRSLGSARHRHLVLISPTAGRRRTGLTADQKAWLSSRLESEIAAKQAVTHLTLGQALASPKVLTLSLIYFGFVGALYGMQFWLPQIVKAFGFSNAQTGFVTAVPICFGTVCDDPVGAAFGCHARNA